MARIGKVVNAFAFCVVRGKMTRKRENWGRDVWLNVNYEALKKRTKNFSRTSV